MPQAQDSNILNSVNKVLVVIFLIIIIAVSITYIAFRISGFFIEPVPQAAPVQAIQDEEKAAVLDQLEQSNSSSVNARERSDVLKSISSTTTVNEKDRESSLNSLR